MALSQENLNELVRAPSESLNAEVKSWIDPRTDDGKKKILKGVMALYNQNGGYFIVGFSDPEMVPVACNFDAPPEAVFIQDDIQQLIARHSSQSFEVELGFGYRDDFSYPVIAVPSGVRTPTAMVRPFPSNGPGQLTKDSVFVRTLRANNTVSSATAECGDWEDVVTRCFENREADIGRFLRRHLTADALAAICAGRNGDGDEGAVGFIVDREAALRRRAVALMERGDAETGPMLLSALIADDRREFLLLGRMTVAATIDPPHVDAIATEDFLNTAYQSNPRYTGWPAWPDLRNAEDPSIRPRFIGGEVRQSVVSIGMFNHAETSILNPKGEFYRSAIIDDDLAERIEPGTFLDPFLLIYRVGEVIAVLKAMYEGLGWEADSKVAIHFRLTKLSGRSLRAWANPRRLLLDGRQSHEQEITSTTIFRLDTANAALAPVIRELLRPVIASFDGFTLPERVYDDVFTRLIERRG